MPETIALDALDLSRYIRPGDGIVFGQGTGQPLDLTQKLVEQRAGYSGATVFFSTCFSKTFQPEHTDHLRLRGSSGIGAMRKLVAAGKVDPIPCHVSAVAGLIRSGHVASDVVMLQVSPPNEAGEHSFGLVNDYLRAAIARARVVIAEVNSQVPWTPCDQPLRADEITVAVHSDTPPLELPAASFGALERTIARNIAGLIPDRATLQMGIGGVPEAIVAMLSDRRDLGIHSGMVGDSAVDLMESGVVTNAHKGIDAGVTVTGVLFGTRRLYRFAHLNKAIRLCPTGYTHHVATLSQVRNLVAVNSALEIDLTGQVNAEAIGADYIGAVGGQVDFVRGAALSEGGVSIMALAATGRNGDSKLVARLSGPVTTARSDVDVVATEFGVAHLRGKGLRQRIRALVAIAAPQHRDGLLAEAIQVWGEA